MEFFLVARLQCISFDITICTCLNNLYHVILLFFIAEYYLCLLNECIDGNKILLTYLLHISRMDWAAVANKMSGYHLANA